MKQFSIFINVILLCSSVILGQEKYQRLPQVDISQIWHSASIAENDMEYDPLVDDIMNQINLDTLIAYVRILSGEDSVWINGSRVRIQHRVNFLGNDLTADYLKQKLQIFNLDVYDQIYSFNGRNIYAIQPGYLYPEKQYIVCAHYDAVDDYCADDNASGVAAVLETARILSGYDFKYTLVYGLWDQEEIGLVGSQYYASQAQSYQLDIQGVLNMDMLGWDGNGDGLFDIHTRDIANSDSLANLLMIINSLYNLPLNPVIYNPGTWQSDHSSFWDYGYGAILLIEAYYGGDLNPYYHSSQDRINRFDLTYFHNLSKLSIGAISTLVEINEDALIVTVSPDKGYQKCTADLVIKGLHTSFIQDTEALEVLLSQGSDTIRADSFIVQSNTSLTAYFYIPPEVITGLWDVNVKTSIDGILSKENCFEILPPPPLISVTPDTLNVSIESGSNAMYSLNIQNNGIGDLNFEVSCQGDNYALQFNGIDGYVEVPDDSSLKIRSNITIEAWIKPTDTQNWRTIVSKFKDMSPPGDLYFVLFQNRLTVALNGLHPDHFVSDIIIDENIWTHIAMVYDGDSLILIKNGIQSESIIASGDLSLFYNSNPMFIGMNVDWGEFFEGVMDELRIWDKALTLEEIRGYMYNPPDPTISGLISYWDFNKAAGDSIFDLSRNKNHGLLQGGVEWVNDGAPVDPAWLAVEPDCGICTEGSTIVITLYFDASELDPGEYSGLIILSSDDPFNPIVHIPIRMSVTGSTAIAQKSTYPKEFKLHQNYPNPFNPSTTIEFSIPKAEFVTVKIYNILGEEVATLLSEKLTAGRYKYEWDASGMASGVYMYRIQAGDYIEVKKMVLLR